MRRALAGVVLAAALAACAFTPLSSSRWGCGRHPYVINPTGAPAGGVSAVHEAARQLNAASGGNVSWYYAGTTTATGARDGLVVISWRDLPSGYAGQAVPQPWPNGPQWTGGVLWLDLSPATLGVALHEWAHVAGAAHRSERTSIMYPTGAQRFTAYDSDTYWGLRQLASECT